MDEIEVIQPGALAAQAHAEIDIQIATAHRYPRDRKKAIDSALEMATMSYEVVVSLEYRLERENRRTGKVTVITGPSIRLAEIIFSVWRNLRGATQIDMIDERSVTASAMVWDLETNVARKAQVRKSIVTRGGKRYSEDMIATVSQAAQETAFRNAVFKVVPKSIVNDVVTKAHELVAGNKRGFAAKAAKIADDLSERFQVSLDRVLFKLDIANLRDIEHDSLQRLFGFRVALDEQLVTPEQLFPYAGRPAPESGETEAPDTKEGFDLDGLKSHS